MVFDHFDHLRQRKDGQPAELDLRFTCASADTNTKSVDIPPYCEPSQSQGLDCDALVHQPIQKQAALYCKQPSQIQGLDFDALVHQPVQQQSADAGSVLLAAISNTGLEL